MTEDDKTETAKNLTEFMQALADLREMLMGAVAGLVADGFTDEQARQIVTRIFSNTPTATGEEG